MKEILNFTPLDEKLIITVLQQAEISFQKQCYSDAQELIYFHLARYPKDHRLLFALAMLNYKLANIEESKRILHQLIEDKDNVNELYIHNLAAIYNDQNNYQMALNLSLKALEINPSHLLSIKNIASIFFKNQNYPQAKIYYQKILVLRPDDQEALLFLNVIDNNPYTNLSKEYIKNLFNDYANDFENHLTNVLECKIPEQVINLLAAHLSQIQFNSKFKTLDLGCGTGLLGQSLLQNFPLYSFNLTGVDLSNKMIDITRKKDIYNKLYVQDIANFLKQENKKYNLVIAADVIVYFGALEVIIKLVHNILESTGIFVFNIETNDQLENYRLVRENMRFKHNLQYVCDLLLKYNFKILENNSIVLRKNKLQNVMGNLIIVQKI